MGALDHLLRVRQAWGPTFLAETAELLFLMNLTGTAQIYSIARRGGWPDLLTDGEERITFVEAAPIGHLAVFGRDRGGNEHEALFAMTDDGRDVWPLTSNPEALHRFGGFRHDGQAIAYSSNARNGRDFDIYIRALDPEARAHMVLEGSGDWQPVGFSPQDDALLLSRFTSNLNNDLYLLDLGQMELMHLTPHEGSVRYLSPRFGLDAVYCLTDQDRNYLGLAVRRLEPAASWTSLRTPENDLEALAVSPDGQRLAYAVNRGGFSQVYLYQISVDREELVEGFGDGVVGGLVFSPDGAWLAAEFQTPNYPLNIWLLSAESGFARPLTRAPLLGLDPDGFPVPTVSRTPSFDGRPIEMLVYRPPTTDNDAPVVMALHGGPESQERPRFNPLYQAFLASGFAVVAPNVRGSTGYGKTFTHLDDRGLRMDAVRDMAAVADWIRGEPGLDGQRIALFGGSYGGYMVLMGLCTFPETFCAGVDLVGIANLETFLERTGPWRRALREPEYGYLDRDREMLRNLSPISHIDQIVAPLMVIHGQNDPRVPVSEAEQIAAALRDRGVPVALHIYPNEGHGLSRLANRLDAYPRVIEFLSSVFSGRPAGDLGSD